MLIQNTRSIASSTLAMLLLALHAAPAAAFCELGAGHPCGDQIPSLPPKCHTEITQEGLSFLRASLVREIVSGNLHMDHEHGNERWEHGDSCEFATMGSQVNYILTNPEGDGEVEAVLVDGTCLPTSCDTDHVDQKSVTGLLNPREPDPVFAARTFGNALHPIQDIYSHSNWLETFYRHAIRVEEIPLMEPTVDLWFTQPWVPLPVPAAALSRLGVDGVVFAEENGYDDWPWGGPLQNRVVTIDQSTQWAAIWSDTNTFVEDECVDDMGASHDVINKDDSCQMDPSYHHEDDHYAAAALATRQTSQEWCRLLHLTFAQWSSAGAASAMGFWVDPDAPKTGPGSPHPPGTQCEASAPGPVEITVDVDSIRVLNDREEEGRLNFVLSLFTHDFTRSDRSAVSIGLHTDDAVIGDGFSPAPLTLCLSEEQANAAVATVQGWVDMPGGEIGVLEFEDFPTFPGVSAEVALHALGVHTVASSDAEVTFDIQNTPSDTDNDGLTRCNEELLGTLAADADSDDDGVDDGTEVSDGTSPLDNDSDDDALTDGEEAAHGSDPLNADTDDDGLTDGAEVHVHGTDPVDADTDGDLLGDGTEIMTHGTDPLDPDSDVDGLIDGIEVQYGTNPLDSDSDDDGLIDGQDVEWIASAVRALPASAFSQGAGHRTAMLSLLNDSQASLKRGSLNAARENLMTLIKRTDGCGPRADRNDWIVDCGYQVEIRNLVQILLDNVAP
jgi:hypothetical protein